MEEFLLSTLTEFNNLKQQRSAEALASLFIDRGVVKAPILFQYARALHGLGEYRKATKICARVIETLPESAPEYTSVILLAADCHTAIRNYKVAFQLYKKIPPASHTICSVTSMAKVALALDKESTAISLFQQALEINPFCLEAVLELIELDAFPNNFFAATSSLTGPNCKNVRSSLWNWYRSVVSNLHCLSKNMSVPPKIKLFESTPGSNALFMTTDTKRDLLHLRVKAVAAIRDADYQLAISIFDTILSIDRYASEDMHYYAYALAKTGSNVNALHTLTYSMLNLAPRKASTWLVVATWYDVKKKTTLALQHIHRVISIDPRNWLAHLFRGELYLRTKDHTNAIRSIRQAWHLSKSICAGEQYVLASLKSDPRNALAHASEVYNRTGGTRSARSLALMGRAYATDPTTHDLALQYLNKALQLDPKCASAYIGMANLQLNKAPATSSNNAVKSIDLAVKVLQDGIAVAPCEALYMELGELYLRHDKLYDALNQFSLVLLQNPLSERASTLFSEVQALLRGSLDSYPQEEYFRRDNDAL
ncbi:uncharacterized protein LOC126317495 [Schistocerca gregaria]|uniref:uncharacterized protein LOC126317495 n=1 Tax=Schistocerca gregaria TaxID=7010 RepID=UPI00211ED6DC|nr:uncharacterized protein LOC126317495 [Schistocerca gregaria]